MMFFYSIPLPSNQSSKYNKHIEGMSISEMVQTYDLITKNFVFSTSMCVCES